MAESKKTESEQNVDAAVNNAAKPAKESASNDTKNKNNKEKNVDVSVNEKDNSAHIQISISNLNKFMILLTVIAVVIIAILKIAVIWGGYNLLFFRLMETIVWLCSGLSGVISIYYFIKNRDKLYIACLVLNLLSFFFFI